MHTPSQLTGASLDELLRKLRDVELAVRSLNTDLKSSEQFKAALGALQKHAKGGNGPALATVDEVKCVELIERYFSIYREYLHSPLGDEFSETRASEKKTQKARSWWPAFNRRK